MSTVGNVKIARSEISYYCIHIPTFHIVWLLRNLSFDGKLCLRDDKNTEFHPLSLQASLENVMLRLNRHSLGTMSAFGCIENLA